MKKEGIKKMLSVFWISLTILGVGGVTISLINITIVFESERGEVEYSDVQNVDSIVKESSTSRNDENVEVYNNSVEMQVRCASVLALDTNQEYIPVSYAVIELDEDMCCTLSNESKTYRAEIEEGRFVFSNVIPGEYAIVFESSGRYVGSKGDVSVSENSQIECVIDTKYQDESLYEEYRVAYENCQDKYFMFMDADGKNKIVDGKFRTDENGTFFLKVLWELSHDVHIHLVNGSHTNVKIEERYNGGTFIN